jgi:putative transposase
MRLVTTDRWFWVRLSRSWTAWRTALIIVKPETVIMWHRQGFRLWWTWKCRRRTGRPTVPAEVRALIRTMSQANSLWGAPRIHGELFEAGCRRLSSVRGEVHGQPRQPPSETWRTFLANPLQQIAAADFFVVLTATCRLFFVLVILAHERRRVVHVEVTDRPTAAWTAQQLREAFPWNEGPGDLIRDRDSAFHAWTTTAAAMGIEEIRTAPRSPWQHANAERLIGSYAANASITSSSPMNAGCAASWTLSLSTL